MVDKLLLGKWGEDLAAQHLEKAGYEVVARNWRCKIGELDIVARAGSELVFVEVKTRTGTAFGEPAEAVTPVKARRLRLLAGRFLVDERPTGWHDVRFDVIAVVRRHDRDPELTHLEGAL